MDSFTWQEILNTEGVKTLYPMHYRPNKDRAYSIFLISDISMYEDIENSNASIDYEGTAKQDWVNKEFYDLAKQTPSERIKIYYKKSTNEWYFKGFYSLKSSKIENFKYRFHLTPILE